MKRKRYDKQKEQASGHDYIKKIVKFITIGSMATIVGLFLDNIIIRLMNSISFMTMNYIFIAITTLGETYIFALLAAILAASLIAYRKPALAFIISIPFVLGILWLIKQIISRPRPFEVGLTDAGVSVNWSSFPSGHTMVFFSLLPMITKKFPNLRAVFWIIAVLVGVSRIYLGVHYTSDVIAGAFIGYGIGWIFMDIEETQAWKRWSRI